MSDISRGPGWWIASDGKWYPPEQHPAAAVPTPAATVTDGSTEPVPRVALLDPMRRVPTLILLTIAAFVFAVSEMVLAIGVTSSSSGAGWYDLSNYLITPTYVLATVAAFIGAGLARKPVTVRRGDAIALVLAGIALALAVIGSFLQALAYPSDWSVIPYNVGVAVQIAGFALLGILCFVLAGRYSTHRGGRSGRSPVAPLVLAGVGILMWSLASLYNMTFFASTSVGGHIDGFVLGAGMLIIAAALVVTAGLRLGPGGRLAGAAAGVGVFGICQAWFAYPGVGMLGGVFNGAAVSGNSHLAAGIEVMAGLGWVAVGAVLLASAILAGSRSLATARAVSGWGTYQVAAAPVVKVLPTTMPTFTASAALVAAAPAASTVTAPQAPAVAPAGSPPVAAFCPSCGTARGPGASFCVSCGHALTTGLPKTPVPLVMGASPAPPPADQPAQAMANPAPQAYAMRYCQTCGNAVVHTAMICPRCGSSVSSSTPRTKTTAVLLAIFLSFWTWLYTFKADSTKFWIGLGVGIGAGVLSPFLLGIPLLGPLGIWIWAIVDAASKPETWYQNCTRVRQFVGEQGTERHWVPADGGLLGQSEVSPKTAAEYHVESVRLPPALLSDEPEGASDPDRGIPALSRDNAHMEDDDFETREEELVDWASSKHQGWRPGSPHPGHTASPAITPAQLEQLATTADAAGLHERAAEYRALQAAGSSRRTE